MKFYGVCPASCGEFVQGVLDNEEYLSSYAINLFSVATLEEGKEVIHTGPKKSRRAMELVFEKFNIPVDESKKISLNINSQIPIGKGMASSTADIGATINATLSMLGKTLTGEEISKLAVKIEATDSLLLNRHSIFNPLTADIKKYMGGISNAKVVILEPDDILDTKSIRMTPNYRMYKMQNKEIIKKSFSLLDEGLDKNDLSLVGKACTYSSLANENIHKKPFLKEIIEISDKFGCYGVNIAHSGTVIGILMDKEMDDKRVIQYLREIEISKYYKKIYTSDIIDGKIREEVEWNILKTQK
ncbi:GHMP family kinase ATP-binding protein [Intestinibacter sp.]|uniref:GHMP family kinase ATP-binding protein n=1 Tax=Intestinibacter sp. TaxID=1965304 RepID=UPI002A75CFDC|nr:serine/threonine protein kinase [Intestinibacter sp.]MDY2737362.1 serine/threonine protein kinase [Intestinibacter sp.]MDY4574952.1 serine/threonine protein kinase [Intestinibacter sp.]